MKHVLAFVSVVVVVSLALGACAGAGPAAAGQDATQPPQSTEPPSTEPAIVPVDLAGPPMEVGSFYSYIDGSILAAVPAGPFTMGFNNFFDSKEHTVTVSDFWIYTSEVTNKQYALCVKAGKCTPPDPISNPVFGGFFSNFFLAAVGSHMGYSKRNVNWTDIFEQVKNQTERKTSRTWCNDAKTVKCGKQRPYVNIQYGRF